MNSANRFPEKGLSKEKIFRLLFNFRKKDLDYSRILSSMCTVPHEISLEVYKIFQETNLGDEALFRGTKEIEKEVVGILAELLNADPKEIDGFILTGGTEANITALWIARNIALSKGIEEPEIITSEAAHFSIDKACDLLRMKVKKVKLCEDFSIDVEEVEKAINENTAAIVAFAGNTEYGAVDNIEELGKIAEKYGIYLHVDAAFGGFVIPFLRELGYRVRNFDFSIKAVKSITIDAHKMGLAPIPAGGLLLRKGLIDYVCKQAPYLIKKRSCTLVGTRSGASAAVVYSILLHLGKEGFRSIVRECMDVTNFLKSEIVRLGFKVNENTLNILTFKCDEKILEILRKKWAISTTRKKEARIVVMPHVSKSVAENFIKDLENIVNHESGNNRW